MVASDPLLHRLRGIGSALLTHRSGARFRPSSGTSRGRSSISARLSSAHSPTPPLCSVAPIRLAFPARRPGGGSQQLCPLVRDARSVDLPSGSLQLAPKGRASSGETRRRASGVSSLLDQPHRNPRVGRELPLRAVQAEDVKLADTVRVDAPLVLGPLVSPRLSSALGAAKPVGLGRWGVIRFRGR